MPNPKATDTLLSHLRVQEKFDRKMYTLLRQASTDADVFIKNLVGKENIGSVIQLAQARETQKYLHLQMAAILQKEGFGIRAAEEEAAAASIDAMLPYDQMLLRAGLSREAMAIYENSAKATAKAGVAAAKQRLLGTSYVPLSQQVYRTTQLATGMVDRLVESSLARGLSARQLAKSVKDMIRPDVPGGVSYASLRLGRTEVNNAFHATSAEKGRETPWVEAMQWNLSASHPEPDLCNEFAEDAHFPRGGAGMFLPNEVPVKPHPQCFCYITPVTPTQDVFIASFLRGDYDTYLDSMIGRSVRAA